MHGEKMKFDTVHIAEVSVQILNTWWNIVGSSNTKETDREFKLRAERRIVLEVDTRARNALLSAMFTPGLELHSYQVHVYRCQNPGRC
jgi:hypothetical protein